MIPTLPFPMPVRRDAVNRPPNLGVVRPGLRGVGIVESAMMLSRRRVSTNEGRCGQRARIKFRARFPLDHHTLVLGVLTQSAPRWWHSTCWSGRQNRLSLDQTGRLAPKGAVARLVFQP